MIVSVAPRRLLAALGAMLALGAVGCSGGGSEGGTTAPPPPPPSQPPLDVSGWVTATDGAMPLVIVAPHGGDLSPAELPDRTCVGCVTGNDTNTRELAAAISDAFFARIGRRPFVVANRLHRSKFDGNRELQEATNGYARLAPMWDLLHERIDSAKARATRVHPRALLIDLHGHGHGIQRLELGYLLTAAELRRADSLLTPLVGGSSIGRLHGDAVSGDAGVALLTGPRALGSRLAALGVPAVPSAADRAPADGDPYFNGGYNTLRHGARAAGMVDAVQIEHHYVGIRDTAASRAAYAERFVTAMLQFLADHYGWTPPA